MYLLLSKGLKEFGINFSIIKNLIKYKNYHMIKRKYYRELKLHPHLIKLILHAKKNCDKKLKLLNLINYYKKKDYSKDLDKKIPKK